jgi:hypothetical protein
VTLEPASEDQTSPPPSKGSAKYSLFSRLHKLNLTYKSLTIKDLWLVFESDCTSGQKAEPQNGTLPPCLGGQMDIDETTEELLTPEFARKFPSQFARLWKLDLETRYLAEDLAKLKKLNEDLVSMQIAYLEG